MIFHNNCFQILLSLFFVVLVFNGCKTEQKSDQKTSGYYLADVNIDYTKITKKDTLADADINKMIVPFRDSLQKEMGQVIGNLNENLDKKKPNSKLGNWMADVFVEEGEKLFEKEIDFGIQNHGGIRVSTLAAGPITKSDIFELMPFDNMLIYLNVDSSKVKMLCDKMAQYGGWPISSGLNFEIKDSLATNIKIGGKLLDNSRNYSMVLPDYVANGGNGCFFLQEEKQINSGVFIRELLINNILEHREQASAIMANGEKRIF